jgi:hypothetical protein
MKLMGDLLFYCFSACSVRIPINSDTCSNPFRTVFRDIRTVVGAKRRSALTYRRVSELSQVFPRSCASFFRSEATCPIERVLTHPDVRSRSATYSSTGNRSACVLSVSLGGQLELYFIPCIGRGCQIIHFVVVKYAGMVLRSMLFGLSQAEHHPVCPGIHF